MTSEPAIAAPYPAGGGFDETRRVPGRGGHGGAGHIEPALFVRSVRERAAPPVGVYDSAAMGAIIPVSEQSIAPSSAPVKCPISGAGGGRRRNRGSPLPGGAPAGLTIGVPRQHADPRVSATMFLRFSDCLQGGLVDLVGFVQGIGRGGSMLTPIPPYPRNGSAGTRRDA